MITECFPICSSDWSILINKPRFMRLFVNSYQTPCYGTVCAGPKSRKHTSKTLEFNLKLKKVQLHQRFFKIKGAPQSLEKALQVRKVKHSSIYQTGDKMIQGRCSGDSALNVPLMKMCCRCASPAGTIMGPPSPTGQKEQSKTKNKQCRFLTCPSFYTGRVSFLFRSNN